ncbi:hypothetical protein CHCC20335_4250 [Bacillus paralicheniformis]|nr:hypothetical protein CHCC20335_4250 [Bacillus paralicheniformis]
MKKRTSSSRYRFENKLIRVSNYPFALLVEDLEGFKKY